MAKVKKGPVVLVWDMASNRHFLEINKKRLCELTAEEMLMLSEAIMKGQK